MADAPANIPARLDNFNAIVAQNMARPGPSAPAVPPPSPVAAKLPPAPTVPVAEAALADAADDEGDPLALLPGEEQPPADGIDPEEEPSEPAKIDLLEEMLHGKKGREILEAIKGGSLPDELLEAIKGVAKVNGQEMPVTFREALNGFQRLSDYSRHKNEALAMKREAQETIANTRALFDGWTTGEALLRDIKKLNKLPAFREAALAYAQNEVRNAKWERENPEAFRLHQQLEQEREEREKLAQQMRQQPDHGQERVREQAAQLQKLVFPALEKHGVKDSPWARQQFQLALEAHYEEGADLAQVVDAAARTVAELLAELAAKHAQIAPPPAPAVNGKNPSPLPGRQVAPAAATTAGGPRRMTPQQFAESLAKQRAAR